MLSKRHNTSRAQRRKAIKDALIFRSYWRTLFSQADSEERVLETHEGLAEYTGIKLSGVPDIAQYVASQLKEAEKKKTFVRSFGLNRDFRVGSYYETRVLLDPMMEARPFSEHAEAP